MTKFDHSETLCSLMMKLPFSMRSRWRRLVDDAMEECSKPIKFSQFVDFVNQESRIINNPVYGNISVPPPETRSVKSRKPAGERYTRVKHSGSTFASTTARIINEEPQQEMPPAQQTPKVNKDEEKVTTSRKCYFCEGNHILEGCPVLRKKPYQERINYLSKKRLCFGCLKPTHQAKNCPNRSHCNIKDCNKRHPTVLHTERYDRENNKELPANTTRSGYTNMKGARTAMAIVPVKVWTKHGQSPICTYAFLDNGSNRSFCTEKLLNLLGIQGRETPTSLTTMERMNSVKKRQVILDLKVSDLEENTFINLPAILSSPAIPVTGDDIPTQDDVDRWTHLEGIKITNIDAEVDLLIACDVPEALDPQEVRHSQNGGPYASKTILGWTINGPLWSPQERHKSFSVKTDPESLIEMIEEYYNRDFNDTASDSPTLSVDEQRFVANANDSCKLINGKYSVSLPFKENVPNFPDNKELVVRRTNWLKQKLLKDERFRKDYKNFMEDLMAKGFAEEIPQERLKRNDNKV